MGNFDFVRTALPTVYPDAACAESYLASDPRSACFYSRRTVEELMRYLFDVIGLAAPYKDDLAARINDAAFKASTGTGITAKLNLIRKFGNTAVHENRPIPNDAAVQVVRELHHVLIWAAFHHSAHPAAVPTGTAFDPKLASASAPLSRQEVSKLAEKFEAQDAAHARALAEKDELLAAHQAQLTELRNQVASAQEIAAAADLSDEHDYDEARTRLLFIDVLLRESGWLLDGENDREYEVTGMPNSQGKGYVDYVLWGADGAPLAIVEAKRTSSSPEIGRQQAKLYADCLERQFGRRPIIYCTNGYQHWIWDDARYAPRQVQGFHTADELELMVRRRQAALPLSTAPINTEIAGRPYQTRAIKAVGDAFDQKQREALLVMATGAGKTRTVIALVDQLMKANWVKRVLFLADRTALVTQATNAFKTHLPQVTTVNLVTEKSADGRVFVSTYPTMLNLINQVDDDSGRRFGPGYFDLVIIDEAHRSVYAKYGAIFDYFDSLLVGLTATPKDEVDHNTYRLFHLEDGVPTDAYSLEEAVADKHLVPPKGVSVGTKFLRQGIKYADLTDEEKDQWDGLDWGEGDIPDEVGAEELNRFLFNEDTVDKVLATLMTDGIKVAGGDRIGKTIIFAKNQQHAEFIARRFDLGWPEHAGQLARVITHSTTYAQSLIDDFGTTEKAPHIAISVDMLDTGIDVPDVVNLVFFKLVRAKSKFWQMIGRGTRLRPDLFGPGQDKQEFLVFDFCRNLEYFSQDLPGSKGSVQKSLTQRIVESRIALVRALTVADTDPELRENTGRTLHEFVSGMTLQNVIVRPHRKAVEHFTGRESWASLSADDARDLIDLAGLPSGARDSDEEAKRFDLLILRRQLAQLEGDAVAAERVRESVQAIATSLLGKTTIPSVAQQAELLEAVAGDEWWVDVTLPMLDLARLRLRGLLRFVEKTRTNPVYSDFADLLTDKVVIVLPGITPGTDIERFRAKTTTYLREHLDHVALQRLRRNRQLTGDDLQALEQMVLASGGDRATLDLATERNGGLGLFVRSLVGLDREAAQEAFSAYLDQARFTVTQVRFVELIVDELTTNGVVEPGRLFESPYTDHAPTGPDHVFPETEVEVIYDILRSVRATAVPAVVDEATA